MTASTAQMVAELHLVEETEQQLLEMREELIRKGHGGDVQGDLAEIDADLVDVRGDLRTLRAALRVETVR